MPFDLQLSARGESTLTRELHGQLRAAILDGRLKSAAALPATRRMADALGIARNTVIAAYDLLVAEGYLISRRGATPVVSEHASRRAQTSPAKKQRLHEHLNPMWRTSARVHADPQGLPARCFRVGIPEHRYFPHAMWRQLSGRALRTWSKQEFSYYPTEGIAPLREAIAQHVAFARAVVCDPGDVIVTSGAQQAFDLLARVLVTPGQTKVAIEEPGYPAMRGAFLAAGARLVSVPVDNEGLRVDLLPKDVRIVNITPSHQAPTGVVMSLQRRTALLEFARAHDALIIEDDYDGEFRFGGRPLDALQMLDRQGRVFYVGTFSKILFPSMRKGFIVSPAWAREAIINLKECADSHCDFITQHTLAAFIHDGHLVRYVRRMKPIYAARRSALLSGLSCQLGEWLDTIPSEAGLHLTARIRKASQAKDILMRAQRHTPGAESTARHSTSPHTPPMLAFGYGVIDVDDIKASLSRLRTALRKL